MLAITEICVVNIDALKKKQKSFPANDVGLFCHRLVLPHMKCAIFVMIQEHQAATTRLQVFWGPHKTSENI